MTAITVYGQVTGGAVRSLTGCATVGQVRAAMSLDASYQASVNGRPANDSQALELNAVVTFAPKVKGA